jgi:hypothetical protein
MRKVLALPGHRFLFVQEDSGVLYMTVAAMQTDRGTGWFDQAVLFCPFCGTQLQTSEEIKGASRQP